MPAPGEPLFTAQDTLAAVALAEEEADTCPSCGMPRAWCRDDEVGRKRFDVREERCWASYRIALRQEAQQKEKKEPAAMRADRISATFRPGYEPGILDGLDLALEEDSGGDHGRDDR